MSIAHDRGYDFGQVVAYNARCRDLAVQNGYPATRVEGPGYGEWWLVPHEFQAIVDCEVARVGE